MDEALCEGRHGLKRLRVGGLGSSTCDKPPEAPGLCSVSVGRASYTSPTERHWGPCST